MIVDCAYRVMEGGEIFRGSFDTDTGAILNQTIIPPIGSLTAVEFFLGNYIGTKYSLNEKELFNYLVRFSGVLITINLNDNRVILVQRDSYTSCTAGEDNFLPFTPIEKEVFRQDLIPIGVRRAPVYTLDYSQSICYAYGLYKDGSFYVITKHGLIPVDGAIQADKSFDIHRYQKLLFDPHKYYSTCLVNGEHGFLYLNKEKKKFEIMK